jgi:hypothetical protein
MSLLPYVLILIAIVEFCSDHFPEGTVEREDFSLVSRIISKLLLWAAVAMTTTDRPF